MYKYFNLLFVLIILFLLISCSKNKEYKPLKYTVGDIVCFNLDKTIKGQVIRVYEKRNGYDEGGYTIRYIANTEQTNTSLLFSDGDIKTKKFSKDNFYPFEICDCNE